MNNKLIVIVIVGLLVATISGYVIFNSQKMTPAETSMEQTTTPEPAMKEDTSMMTNLGTYMPYSKTEFANMNEKKRVYFFHAAWCPTCKAANTEFTDNAEKIPTDVVVFKTDYDTEATLKKQYGITYQHTYVYVDAAGKEIKKWNGGGITELIENTN